MKRILLLCACLLAVNASLLAQNRPSNRGFLTSAVTSCTPSNAQSSVVLTPGAGDSSATVQTSGTFTGTVAFAVTADGTNWLPVTGSPMIAGLGTSSTASTGIWQINIAGMSGVCAYLSSYTSGAANVSVASSHGTPDDSNIALVPGTSGVGTANQPAGMTVTVVGGIDAGGNAIQSYALGGVLSVRQQLAPTLALKLPCNALRKKNCQ